MKQIFSIILLATGLAGFTQDIDRSKAPEPTAAPVIKIADPASFTLPNGLKVFVVRNTKLPQVSATLTIDRMPVSEGKKAGLVSMTGAILRYGTTKMNKEKLDEEVDFLGGSLSSSPTSVSGNSLTTNFPKLFALMADVALRPAFASADLEKIRKQTLSGLESAKDNPEAISSNVTNVLFYGKNHPYGEIETEETVKAVTIADVKKHYQTYWKPNIAYLVFVGDITVAQAKTLATTHFGKWAKGVIPKQTYPAPPAYTKNLVAIIDRPASVQSVIKVGTVFDLKPGSEPVIPSSLMNTLLGAGFSSRLMQNLREKYGFTYGARSSVSPDRLVGNFTANASVRNEKTDSAIGQFLVELERIGTELPGNEEVSSQKNYMSGGFARSLENPATIANFALNIARYKLPANYYRNYLTRLNSVTPNQVVKMGNEYVSSLPKIITIVGNAKEIAAGLEKYGEVKYFDMYGNEVAAPVVKTVDATMKAEDILKKAITAYGGETLKAVKDIQLNGKVSVMGQTLDYVQKNVFPSGFATSVMMQGMAVMKQSKKGETYSTSMQGNDMPVDDAGKQEMNARAAFFEENYFLSQPGVILTVKGIEAVDGKDAYVVDIAAGSHKTTAFYDVASGYKVQERSQRESPMGSMSITTRYMDYKNFEGLFIPTKLNIDLGQFKQDIVIESVKINQGLTEADL